MYGLIHLEDGSTEYIPNAERFERLVYERLGRDAAEIVAELVRQGDETTRKLDNDLLAYESENEALLSAVMQADDMAERLRDYVMHGGSRTLRRDVVAKLDEIVRTLEEVI